METLSRRQGLGREVWSEGSLSAKPGVDVQEGDTRPSSRDESAIDDDVQWKRNRVNHTAIRGKRTFLSGEICLHGSRIEGHYKIGGRNDQTFPVFGW